MDTILPVLLFVVIAAAVSVGLIILPFLVAPRRRGAVKEMPYESGMDPIHDTRRRFDVRFHLVAITFLVFDVGGTPTTGQTTQDSEDADGGAKGDY